MTIAASEYGSTTHIGKDTDLFVLLLYHMKPGRKSVFFRSDNKSRSQVRVYNINKLKNLLGPHLYSHLLFIHAVTWCDTTSRVFGVGKKTYFQKFVKGNKDLESCAVCFTNPGQTCYTVEECGYKVMVLLFGGNPTDSLTTLRHDVSIEKEGCISNMLCDLRKATTYCISYEIPLAKMLLPDHDMTGEGNWPRSKRLGLEI